MEVKDHACKYEVKSLTFEDTNQWTKQWLQVLPARDESVPQFGPPCL